jgi:hypothetical protein
MEARLVRGVTFQAAAPAFVRRRALSTEAYVQRSRYAGTNAVTAGTNAHAIRRADSPDSFTAPSPRIAASPDAEGSLVP